MLFPEFSGREAIMRLGIARVRRPRKRMVIACAGIMAALVAGGVTAGSAGKRKTGPGKKPGYWIGGTPPENDPKSTGPFPATELFQQTVKSLFDFKTVKQSNGYYVMQSAGYQPVVGSLATRWTVSPDKKTITINLRKGVKNHLGHTFDAKDVRYTIDRLLAGKANGTFYLTAI